ncbi:MAG TPA: Gfo/Idh/MocA family oxidoreductase [Chloroflexota bacterium]|nr:Gfo/Idh/MocA family oxidoreductase [Chloroflexota bacterium]
MAGTVGYAVVGAGLVGPTHARFAAQVEGCALKVVCDLREDRGRPLADELGAEWMADYRALMRRDDVQVVSICLPTALHLEVARAAAEAGKHVVVEKPIELNLDRALELVDVCRRHGVKLAAIYNRRFVFGTRRTHDAVKNGELGRVLVADMVFKSYRAPNYYTDSGWRGTWSKEGGAALINQGIHGVDLVTWIAGPIKTVQGHSRHLRHQHIEADDTTIAVAEYESGALGVIEQTTSVYPAQKDRIEVHGEKGSILLENYKIKEWQLEGVEPGEPTPEELALPGADRGTAVGHFLQIKDMVDAVRQGREPVIRGADALHPLAVVQAIYEAARTGKPVDVRQPVLT